jgi:WD40 repeat protein
MRQQFSFGIRRPVSLGTLDRHRDSDSVAYAFSPDGNFLASSWGKMVRLWDPITGVSQRTLNGSDWAKSVTFSPYGKFLASVSQYETQIWDLTTGALVGRTMEVLLRGSMLWWHSLLTVSSLHLRYPTIPSGSGIRRPVPFAGPLIANPTGPPCWRSRLTVSSLYLRYSERQSWSGIWPPEPCAGHSKEISTRSRQWHSRPTASSSHLCHSTRPSSSGIRRPELCTEHFKAILIVSLQWHSRLTASPSHLVGGKLTRRH